MLTIYGVLFFLGYMKVVGVFLRFLLTLSFFFPIAVAAYKNKLHPLSEKLEIPIKGPTKPLNAIVLR